MKYWELIVLSLVTLLLSPPLQAQPIANHQMISNGIDQFAFDPALFVADETPPSAFFRAGSVRVHSDLEQTSGYSHITATGYYGLSSAENTLQDGFLGIDDVELASGLSFPFVDEGFYDSPDHRLVDLNGDGQPEAVVLDRGKPLLFFHLGTNTATPTFSSNPVQLNLQQDIQDIAVSPAPRAKVAVIQGNKLRVISAAELEPALTTILPIDPSVRRRALPGETVELPGDGLKVAAAPLGRGTVFAVLTQGKRSLGLTTVFQSARGTLTLASNMPLHAAADGSEGPVAVSLADTDNDDRPEVVVLTSLLMENEVVLGRLRIFDLDSSGGFSANVSETAQVDLNADLTLPVDVDPNCRNQPFFVVPSALRVKDIASASGRDGADGQPDIIVAGNVEIPKCDLTRPFVKIWHHTADQSLQDIAETVVWETFPENQLVETTNVVDLTVGKFNDDALPDIALLDRASEGLIVLRQQPKPCITFITPITHGHRGQDAIQAEFASFGGQSITVPPVAYNDLFNLELSEAVDVINIGRRARAGEPEICPVAHIAVNGHWEQGTSHGAFLHVVGRALWGVSAVLVPTPACFGPPVAIFSPKIDLLPFDYWLSTIWLLMPVPPPSIIFDGCIPLLPNYATVARFLLAGLSVYAEASGRDSSGSASLAAAGSLRDRIDNAVTLGRDAMDLCDGQVAIDTLAFSRGTTVQSSAMSRIDITPLSYKADVSFTLLDAIDPSWSIGSGLLPPPPFSVLPNGDSTRPWAKAGFFVGDPTIVPVGTAMLSSAHASIPGIVTGTLGQLLADIEVALSVPNGVNIERDIVGIPSGYDRSALITSSPVGWFAMGNTSTVTHGNVRTSVLPDAPNGTMPLSSHLISFTGSPTPNFDTATHMGALVTTHRLQPNYPGWSRGPVLPAGERFLPPQCQGSANGDSSSDDTDSSADSQPNSALSGYRSQFVGDPEFNLAQGAVANARELRQLSDDLPVESKQYKLDEIFADLEYQPVVEYIDATAENQLPLGSGVSSWSQPDSCSDCPVVVSSTNASRIDEFKERMSNMLGVDGDDVANIDDFETLSQKWGELLDNGQNTINHDLTHWVGLSLSGASRLDDARMQFGPTGKTISQKLLAHSLKHDNLVLRVFYQHNTTDAFININLNGVGLSVSASTPSTNPINTWQELLVEVERNEINTEQSEFDTLTINAKNATITAVFLTPNHPWQDPDSGIHYEVVTLNEGVDWLAARRILEHRSYAGKKAQLANFSTNDFSKVFDIIERFDHSLPVWLGASGKPGQTDDFEWLSGQPVGVADIEISNEVLIEKVNYLYAHNGKLGSSGTRGSINGQPMSILVEYR